MDVDSPEQDEPVVEGAQSDSWEHDATEDIEIDDIEIDDVEMDDVEMEDLYERSPADWNGAESKSIRYQ
jgi:hypothetical protein